jgi:hypothetical protein
MKKINALLSLSFLLLCFPSKAQNNFRWADSNALWHHTFSYWGVGYLKVTYPYDTIIDGHPCQKLILSKQIKYQMSPDSFYIAPLNLYDNYFLYKSNDSVFSYRNNAFWLAFKTNGTAGDVWDLGKFNWNTHLHAYAKVDSVYYQDYNGQLLRNLKIHPCDSNGNIIPFNMGSTDTLFISGIGCGYYTNYNIINEKFGPLYGFNVINFAFPNNIMIDYFTSSLLCYESASFPFYQLNPSIDCFNNIFTGIEKTESSNGFNLSPNPFSHSTRISFSQSYNDIALEVYNLQGQLLAQNHYENSNAIVFERLGLVEGMYFLKLRLDGQKVETRKIIVSE